MCFLFFCFYRRTMDYWGWFCNFGCFIDDFFVNFSNFFFALFFPLWMRLHFMSPLRLHKTKFYIIIFSVAFFACGFLCDGDAVKIYIPTSLVKRKKLYAIEGFHFIPSLNVTFKNLSKKKTHNGRR